MANNFIFDDSISQKKGAAQRGYQRVAILAALRLLVHTKESRILLIRRTYEFDTILAAVGLGRLAGKEVSTRDGLRAMRKQLEKVELENPRLRSSALSNNIEWLGKTLALSTVEKGVLALLMLGHQFPFLNNAMGLTGGMKRDQVYKVITVSTGFTRAQVARVFSRDATLIASGIIKIDTIDSFQHKEVIVVLGNLLELLLTPCTDPASMLDHYFYPAQVSRLVKKDFEYLNSDLDLVLQYLEKSSRKRSVNGVNILFYGRPGTGKTELARVISQAVQLHLYEITMTDQQGEPISGDERFNIYRLAQYLLASKKQSLILFDEIEDVFPVTPHSMFGNRSRNDGKKAWINRQLEDNCVPAIWISNDIEQIDPAFLRRFDFVLEIKLPSRSVRQSMFAKALAGVPVTSEWLNRMSANENLVPAHISRATKILRIIKPGKPEKNEALLERVIGNTIKAMGESSHLGAFENVSTPYSMGLVNADTNLDALAAGLRQGHDARICFYGPPGTGKTAFADHLSQLLDRPLIKKRASDVFSKWVGQSEKNIASMFQQAQDETAILFLDEADSFLQDRQQARARWEVSQVNELLVQMEQFGGVFIAATNLMDRLDTASLRRFDFKIQFDYLKCDQAVVLLKKMVQQSDATDWAQIKQRLASLSNLALGDFSLIARRITVLGQQWDADQWVDALEQESRAKPDAARAPMGFLNNEKTMRQVRSSGKLSS